METKLVLARMHPDLKGFPYFVWG